MFILIDECVDQPLRWLFSGHNCQTAAYAKLAGLKNGALLAAAEESGFDGIMTTDQEISSSRTCTCAGSGSSCSAAERTA